MAIIKCPECGRQISDKAPTCPHCGVQIAGKVINCAQCGEVYFGYLPECPNCQHATPANSITDASINNNADQKPNGTSNQPTSSTLSPVSSPISKNENPKRKTSKKVPILVAITIVLLISGIFYYFYTDTQKNKQKEDYEFAMKSNDPTILRTLLLNYPDMPKAFRDSVNARLNMLGQAERDWTNAAVSGSKSALEEYLKKHPESEHKLEARLKIDSLDWLTASRANTIEAIEVYLAEHANGEYIEQAEAALKKIKAKTVMPEEKSLVGLTFRRFFQSITEKNRTNLEATVAPILSDFLGKKSATKSDVVTFMEKIYKEDIISMTWKVNDDFKIEKKEVGDEEYEYSTVFTVTQNIDRTDLNKEKHNFFRVSGKVNPDGLITSFSLTKILE